MAELRLPDGPAKLLEAVRAPFGDHLGGEHHMRLGGGTALAARWAHRHSTDVDLFTEAEAYKRLWQRRNAFESALIERAGPARVLSVRRWNTKIILEDGGEITLFTTDPQTDHPTSEDTVRGTLVPLETNAEILAKKLWGRMLDSEALLARDLYDFAVARHHDPDAVKAAMEHIDVSDLQRLKRELESLPQGWLHRPSQRALIRPAYPEEASNPASFVRAQVWREILSRTPSRPHRPPPEWDR